MRSILGDAEAPSSCRVLQHLLTRLNTVPSGKETFTAQSSGTTQDSNGVGEGKHGTMMHGISALSCAADACLAWR